MKIQELRHLLSTADREHLEKAFAESYKKLRKAQKEEIDPVIADILEGRAEEKNKIETKKTESVVNFEGLECQITEFLENANAGYYIAPNRIIPKSQRPKWRFLVRNFIKELDKVPPESEHYAKAVKLLTDIYCLIGKACDYYLFSTEDPFRSIGWEQLELYKLLVRKTFATGYSRENISCLLLRATAGGLSRESLYIEQELVLLASLKTNDVKYIAIEEAKKLVEEKIIKLSEMEKKRSDSKYYMEDAVNELCSMILLTSISLGEPEEGVKYFFQHSRNNNQEITLYCALELIECMGDRELWKKVYEYGVKHHMKPRDSLKAMYEEMLDS